MTDKTLYTTKRSLEVKLITTGFLIAIALSLSLVIISQIQSNALVPLLISAAVIGLILFYYFKSLKKIVLTDDALVIKQVLGEINIPYTKISRIAPVDFSNLTMTTSTKGVFGFIGSSMDNYATFVNDRNMMIKIQTDDEGYLISSDERDTFIEELKKRCSSMAQTSDSDS